MSRNYRTMSRVVLAGAAILTLALTVTAAAAATAKPNASGLATGRVTFRHACPASARHRMTCLAVVDSTAAGRPLTRAAAAADGLHPYLAADLQVAYKLPSALLGEQQTVTIVDAYDDPNAESDLATYRAANNLSPCTTANGCFEKVNQQGQQGNYPPPDPTGTGGWEEEESLDLDMVSAACPNCHIILAEANTANDSDVYAAEDEAANLGANVISNSYGEPEYNGEAADCAHYNHPGIAITVSGGDNGFGSGASFPAACATVTAVGGTNLYPDNSARGWHETAWSYDPNTGLGTGSGCSAYIPKPSWQHDKLCGNRTGNDTAAVAGTATPVAVYDTYGGDTGWEAFAGTSVAAPLVAGVYALAGNTAGIGPGASHIYAHDKDLFDVTTGSNGTCGGSYLCTAVKGYDGPTGWGTPNSIGAF